MTGLIQQLGKNILSSWTSLIVRIVIVFLVNPFIIHSLGNERYGLFILVLSIINYFTICDFGLKQSLIRFVSKYYSTNDFPRINKILNSVFTLYLIVAAVVTLLTFVLSYWSIGLFDISDQFIYEARLVLIIIGISTAINYAFITWGDSLGAFHRYDFLYGLSIGEDVLRTVAVIYILKSGYGLVPFAMMYLIFNLLRNIVGSAVFLKKYPMIRPRFFSLSKSVWQELKKYSLIGFLISVAWLIIVNTDHLLIGYYFTTSQVTIFAIAGGFIVYLRTIILAVSFPLRPLISHYESLNRKENIRLIYLSGIKYISILTFAAAGLALVLADEFIVLWMGPGYEQSALILKILIIPAAIFLPQTVGYSVLYGISRLSILLKIILIEGLVNLVLSIILLRYYGLPGIAYGTIIPQIIIYSVVMPVYMRPILNIKLMQYYLDLLKYGGTMFGLTWGAGYLLSHLIIPDNWPLFVLFSSIIVLLTGIYAYLIIDKRELTDIIGRFKNNRPAT